MLVSGIVFAQLARTTEMPNNEIYFFAGFVGGNLI